MSATRWIGAVFGVALAAVLLFCGWLTSAHLRATDVLVLQRAGEGTASLVDRGVEFERAHNPEAARLLLQAAKDQNLAHTEDLTALGSDSGNESLFPDGPVDAGTNPVIDVVIRLENRRRALAYLEDTGVPAVRDLMWSRALTNTVIFPPSASSAGQAFDAAVALSGLLLAAHHLTPGLSGAIAQRTSFAQSQADAQPLEEILMALMSLGRRMTWGQLVPFVQNMDDPATLTTLAALARDAGPHWPELYADVVLSQKPGLVATWLTDYSETGAADLNAATRFGEGGLNELLLRRQRLVRSSLQEQWASAGPVASLLRVLANVAWQQPWLAMLAKWCCYLSAGFLFAAVWHSIWRAPATAGESGAGRGFNFARELLVGSAFLLVILLASEPYLTQSSQKVQFQFHLSLTAAAGAGMLTAAKAKIMEPKIVITLLLFFVLQALIYCACLFKLAEIKRQNLPARVKLKLLENEEHLFDAGLYLGFAGTIICLILVLGSMVQLSLMAAYSSTSFGIIFVSLFKIFNLRPLRRQLLLQAETQAAAASPAGAPSPLASAV